MSENKRGGYRPGAGRKPIDPAERKVKVSVYLAAGSVEYLKRSSLSMGVQIDMMVSGTKHTKGIGL